MADITISPPLQHVRCAFNKFSDFFVQAFNFVIDSWKFTMLLLYILWEDWSIFMISVSNEQLQQLLEYTLLKPDCHSWWISQMQSGREDTLEERYAIKCCFKLRKDATETYGLLQKDNERCGTSKEVNIPELMGQRVRVRFRVTMLRF